MSANNFLGQEQNDSHEIKISDDKGLAIERIDNESFSITLPDGDKNIYRFNEDGKLVLVSISSC